MYVFCSIQGISDCYNCEQFLLVDLTKHESRAEEQERANRAIESMNAPDTVTMSS